MQSSAPKLVHVGGSGCPWQSIGVSAVAVVVAAVVVCSIVFGDAVAVVVVAGAAAPCGACTDTLSADATMIDDANTAATIAIAIEAGVVCILFRCWGWWIGGLLRYCGVCSVRVCVCVCVCSAGGT